MAGANRNRRGRAQLPTCYHEGFLEKKSIKDKMGRKLWTSLCGDSLFFFNSSKDSVYIEKLELSDLNSVSDDGSRERNLDAAGFTLHMKKEDVRMIAPSLEARELWKGYMLSIAKLSVPVSLNLLPGQIHVMREIIEKEKIRQRLPSASPPEQSFDPYVCVLPDMPMCFHKVSRVEAEILLDRNPNDGNLLLRPAQDGTSFSLTTRQEVNGRSIFKHYRVFRRPEGGFVIDLDSPINCATLHDVVNKMVEKTGGVLVPLHMEKHYDQVLVYLEKNEENGELSKHCAKPDPSSTPPVPPLKPVTKAHRFSSEHENEYRNIPCGGDYEEDEAASLAPPVQPRVPARHLPYQYSMPHEPSTSSDCERKALVPPGYGKKPLRSNSLSDMPKNTPKQQIVMDELAKVINSRRPIQE
ncbi:signal-transducing adaptor protein 2b isoform X3 [Danio aesculapii]|uniref:signal-transducing adaptor protein 2b isoform X3 n=1 Tax=Danio aesculapii TaxID=1142201 RepID=UPI0024BFB5A0|nr:signal-transducing adaptor protein 2b isoform X3 [Danio aesculapii]